MQGRDRIKTRFKDNQAFGGSLLFTFKRHLLKNKIIYCLPKNIKKNVII